MAWVNLLTVGPPYTFTLNNADSKLEISSGYLQNTGYPTESGVDFRDGEGDIGYESVWYPDDQSLTITVPTGTQIRVSVAAHTESISAGNVEINLIGSANETLNDVFAEDPGWILDPSGSPGYGNSNDDTSTPIVLTTSVTYPYARLFVSNSTSAAGTAAFRLLVEVDTGDFDEFWTDEINATETI